MTKINQIRGGLDAMCILKTHLPSQMAVVAFPEEYGVRKYKAKLTKHVRILPRQIAAAMSAGERRRSFAATWAA
jgi:hypothetical protein